MPPALMAVAVEGAAEPPGHPVPEAPQVLFLPPVQAEPEATMTTLVQAAAPGAVSVSAEAPALLNQSGRKRLTAR